MQTTEQEAIAKISALATEYRKSWNKDYWEIADSEKFGYNEFIGGKAEAFEECLEIFKHKSTK